MTADLNTNGWAMLKGILEPAEADAMAALYPQEQGASKVIMARHGFGAGNTSISPTRCLV